MKTKSDLVFKVTAVSFRTEIRFNSRRISIQSRTRKAKINDLLNR